MIGAIGDYFSWAVGNDHGFLSLTLFVVVVPTVALLVGATLLVWILAALKFVGRQFTEGFRRGWSR